VEFSWEGNDECDPANGRGWAVLEEDGSLRGRIFFHFGDDSRFTPVRGGEPTQEECGSGHWLPNSDAGALTGSTTGKANSGYGCHRRVSCSLHSQLANKPEERRRLFAQLD
jgi:hypothetical protein